MTLSGVLSTLRQLVIVYITIKISKIGNDLATSINSDEYIRISFDKYDYSPERIDKNVKLGNTYSSYQISHKTIKTTMIILDICLQGCL